MLVNASHLMYRRARLMRYLRRYTEGRYPMTDVTVRLQLAVIASTTGYSSGSCQLPHDFPYLVLVWYLGFLMESH